MRHPLNRATEVNQATPRNGHLSFFFLLLPLALFLLASPAQAARLQFWRFNAGQNQLNFNTDEGVQPKAQLIANPTRLVIDLPSTTLGRPAVAESYTGAIRAVRVGQFDRSTTRIVMEVAPGYTLNPAQVKFQGTTPQQWLVQLPTATIASTLPSGSTSPGSVPVGGGTSGSVLPKPIIPPGSVVVPTTQPSAGGAPTQPNGGLFQIPPTRPPQTPIPVPPATNPLPAVPPRVPNNRPIVVIDPGHGGPDPGAVGVNGLKEKDIVLDIGKKVATLLQQQGIQAVMARSADIDLDLEPRVDLANRLRATAFVSIHANSINLSRPDISGLETYYYQNGAGLAQSIHQSVLQGTGIEDRSVRQARFYVLKNTAMPSVLVEVGFVTGRDDAAKLSTANYRQTMAESIARGVVRYLGQQAKS
jgi:N-acetylmuramoyl-L-alanine amidase